MFTEEQKRVIETFGSSFEDKKDRNIILYGVGINTKAVVEGTNGFSFIGLMDANSEGQKKYGLSIFSVDEVAARKDNPIIVIIARESVVNVIFKRIETLYRNYGIEIYNYAGASLGESKLKYNNENLEYWNVNSQTLRELIDKHSIITFDVFDTLITRKVLLPNDIFEIAGVSSNFAEKETFDSIKKFETDSKRKLFVPREEMVEILYYAISTGKKVFLLSDMYYPEPILKEILSLNGITNYDELWVSCDRGCSKEDGSMYLEFGSYAKANFGEAGLRILHIGDNRYVDYETAIKHKYDAFNIYGGYELLEASSMQGILSDVQKLGQRCALGIIVAKYLNSPFSLVRNKGYWKIEKEYDLGYIFLGPLVTSFVQWMQKVVSTNSIDQILYPSRDGFLIKQVAELMGYDEQKSVYLRASRRAVTVAGIFGRNDINTIAKRPYYGTVKDFLFARFGIEADKEDDRSSGKYNDLNDEAKRALLDDYETRIINNAKKERKNYLEYLRDLGICFDDKSAIFDFVAGGTVQFYLERIMNTSMHGIYFATMNLPNDMYSEDGESIVSAYGNIKSYGAQNELSKHYLLMETVLIDDKETFSHINENGDEVFERSVKRDNYDSIRKVQHGICDFARDYEEVFGEIDIDLKFADELYGMLFTNAVIVSDEIKKIFKNDDFYDGYEMSGAF